MTLRELRIQSGLTQNDCAKLLGISRRTYQSYESDESKQTSVMYGYLFDRLSAFTRIDEEHGIIDTERIKTVCTRVFSEYDVEYCYLFGSYAKGEAMPRSDIDLLISTSVSGMEFFGLAETLRLELQKKVDLLNVEQLHDNPELINSILKDGIKIYDRT